jgi:hypothetical protein
MKLAAAALATAILELNAWAGQIGPDGSKVVVCMEESGPAAIRYRAIGIATKIYAGIGVTLDWKSGSRACKAADVIHIELAEHTPDKLMPGALAYALPYEGVHIRVFLDRVEKSVGANGLPCVLAHVLVHEIGHILQGLVRHSETGVMKAHWTVDDFTQMTYRSLPFTEQDTILIQRGLEQRSARLLLAAEISK